MTVSEVESAKLGLSGEQWKQSFEKDCAGPIHYEVCNKREVKVYSATDGRNLQVYAGDLPSLRFFNLIY